MDDSPPTFETPRLLLVPIDLAFAEAALKGHESLQHLLGVPVADDFPDTRGILIEVVDLADLNVSAENWFAWSIRDKESQSVIGTIGFHGPLQDYPDAEIGYSVSSAWRERGIGTEALTAFMAWAKTRPNLELILARVQVANLPSLKMLLRAGFEIDGSEETTEDGTVLSLSIPGAKATQPE